MEALPFDSVGCAFAVESRRASTSRPDMLKTRVRLLAGFWNGEFHFRWLGNDCSCLDDEFRPLFLLLVGLRFEAEEEKISSNYAELEKRLCGVEADKSRKWSG